MALIKIIKQNQVPSWVVFFIFFVRWRRFCAFYHLLLRTWLFCLIIPERNNYVFLPRFCPLNEFNVTSIKRALLAKSKYEIHDGKSQLQRFDHFSTLFAPIPISPLSKLQLERNTGKKNQSAIVWSSCLGLVQLYHEGLWWKQGGAKWRSFVVEWSGGENVRKKGLVCPLLLSQSFLQSAPFTGIIMRARRGDNWEFASTEPWLSSPSFQFGEMEPEEVLHKTEAGSEIKLVSLIVTYPLYYVDTKQPFTQRGCTCTMVSFNLQQQWFYVRCSLSR